MKKVLIISYRFPPDPAVGSLRIKGIAKYLPEFGWIPIVLTRNLPPDPSINCIVRNTPYSEHSSIKSFKKKIGLSSNVTVKKQFNKSTSKNRKTIFDRLLNIVVGIIAYPDDQKDWYNYAFEAGRDLIQTQNIDAIISSSYPVTCHIVSHDLKLIYNVPWISDFRDLWTQNHYYMYNFLRKYFEKRLEIKTLVNASVLTTVSSTLADTLHTIHPKLPINSIPNGFDLDEVNKFKPTCTKKFTISYTGTLYQGKRDPSKLFIVLRELINEQEVDPKDIEVTFYGPQEDWMEKEIKKYDLQKIVIDHGLVSRNYILEKQRESQLLLLLLWDNPEEFGVYTGKVFEYLAAKRPILAIGSSVGGVVKKLLEETEAGIYASSVQELKKYIKMCYDECKSKGNVSYQGKEEQIAKYSQKEMARKFAEILDKLVEKN